ncbi:MAG: isocitrate/isopropylmalate dehydrogenase family protein [Candidatus Hydrothermarchaeota archaeon]|nr:isocitrate/isopropylmalate dehydrogenase family protein [Candidatus Hydrothermarchaeota archaeon]MDP6612572.1 isocitrate/isopropylmalate dehydrogenase family protein [Candidatus Hydrothermarchaeota archaeon]
MFKVTLIPGDGIGPEVTYATLHVLEAIGVRIKFEEALAGEAAMAQHGSPLPEELLESIRKNKIALKGPVTTPIGRGFRSVNVGIRQALNLYANLRPAKSYEGTKSKYSNVDLAVVRENTEGLYSGIERFVDESRTVAESVNRITRDASERIVRFAFDYALKEKRGKVTAVHKANILKTTGWLFLQCAKDVAKGYPQVEFEDRIVDNMAMQLVKNPKHFDVIVTTNLFGDILSDLCAGLVGGLGLAPSANIGEDIAVFEPVHGSAPKYASMNKMNPSAMILSAGLMLKHLGETEAAGRIEMALKKVISTGDKVTYDLKGNASTMEMAEAIAGIIEEG